MEKIIRTLIDSWTKGVDTYTHNGSTWLIFTESKQWVIELTDSKTLWYNYNFFKQIFEFTSMDVVENQQYITKWVEDNIIGGGAKETQFNFYEKQLKIEGVIKNGSIDSVRVNEYSLNYVSKQRDCEDTLQNGVRHTDILESGRTDSVEDTLQNGVKETNSTLRRTLLGVDDIIQNGIKETRLEMNITEGEVDDIIQDGVKHTARNNACADWEIEDTIQNGVIYTFGDNHHKHHFVDNVIQNGVRDTQSNPYENTSWIEGVIKKGVKLTLNTELMPTSMVEDIIQNGVRKTLWISVERESLVEKTINNGIKETNHVDVMGFFNNKMEDTLKNGVKETKQKKNALLILDTNGRELILESHLVVRDGVKETSHRQFLKTYDVKDTTQDGTEHDRWILDGCDDPVDVVLDNGVKITTPLQSREYTGDIDEVLGNGVKTSHPRQYVGGDIVDKVIDKGVIETHDDVYHHKGRIDGVIKNGIKETKTPGNGDIVSTVEWMKENNSTSYPKMIDDVIENGVKETVAAGYTDPKTNLLHIKWGDQIDDVIDNGVKEVVSYDEHKRGPVNTFGYIDDIIKEGVKEIYNYKGFRPRNIVDIIDNGEKINGTYAGGQRQSEKSKSVVEYGTKNPTD